MISDNYLLVNVGGNFYWPRFNTQFKLRAEQIFIKRKRGQDLK